MKAHVWFGLVFLLALGSIGGTFFYGTDPRSVDLPARFEAPNARSLLGKDHHGIDILAQVLEGSRSSVGIALVVVFISGAIGLLAGGWSGLRGGGVDGLFMGLTEVFLSIPGVLLSMVLTLLMEPSIWNLCFALTITAWISTARIVRAEVLRLRSSEFIEAARSLGAPERRVLLYHLLPAVLPLAMVTAINQLPGVILSEASLSYLGLGLPLEQVSLGQMIAQGRKYFIESPLQTLAPGVALLTIVLCLQIFVGKERLAQWTSLSRK